jgi:hypothetical protein
MRKTIYVLVTLALAGVIGLVGWRLNRASQPIEMVLYFHPFVGPDPLVLHDSRYGNPGGEGRFEVRDFQFFLSNIRLAGPTGAYAEPDSYHLVRFDGDEPAFRIMLRDVPRRDYERIELGIGVDPAANKSLAQHGDLDPNGRMAWTWEVGYKFVLLEGTLERGGASVPLVYHVGFDENYKQVAIPLPNPPVEGGSVRLDFRVDVLRLFQGGAASVDMAALNTVKFDRSDSARLGSNFAAMITLMPSPNGPAAP